MGNTFKMSFKVKVLNINESEKMDPGAHMPTPRGNIDVYLHNNQTSSPLKPLGQLKPYVCINNPGHMTKMAAMPIYSKAPSKVFSSRTDGPILTTLGMKY